jgi:hypothetical protein
MQLIQMLERDLGAEPSPFRAQLLREDLARLGRLRELARGDPDPGAVRRAAQRLGWTQGDARTHELRVPLEALADAVHAYEHGAKGEAQEARIVEAWAALHRLRLERLVGCLATPVARPAGD